ncbi:MAG: DUF4260 domain-containing protein [Candidatus Levybacteria bacterium]|nr:DUF4260 domain-containing protein [Candidatus Levybacteria bacterium]
MIKLITKLEGLAVLIASLFFYTLVEGNWIVFLLLILLPDISMIGYFKNKKIGSITYNIVHNFFTAFLIITFGFVMNQILIQQLGIIMLAHVGMDRVFGYGLKYPDSFKKTHIQKL